MKLAIATLLAGTAAAFSPAAPKGSPSALKMSYENELGVQEPLGFYVRAVKRVKQMTKYTVDLSHSYIFFCSTIFIYLFKDPLNLLADADQAKFEQFRAAELKHGRVCQLAFLGYLTTWSGVRLPGSLGDVPFADIPAGHPAVFKVPTAGLLQILIFCGFLEIYGFKQAEGSFPGDFTATKLFPVGYLGANSEEAQYKLRAQELNQGRAAQMGVLALLFHEQINGKPFIFFDPHF
jgi:hypothetical protein